MIPTQILPPLIPDSEDDFSSAMESLIELAEDQPKLFRGSLNKVVAFLAQVMKEDSLEESSRQVSLELLLTLAEVAPGTCRKEPSFVPTVIPIMLQWMTTVQDDEAWYSPTAIVDDDEEDLCAVAEQGLDRIARHLGGKVVLPITFQFIPQMVANNNWLQRHAALMAISAIGEGCMKIMSTELEKIVDMILPHLKDPHARVRYAACNAIGQMSTDFAVCLIFLSFGFIPLFFSPPFFLLPSLTRLFLFLCLYPLSFLLSSFHQTRTTKIPLPPRPATPSLDIPLTHRRLAENAKTSSR